MKLTMLTSCICGFLFFISACAADENKTRSDGAFEPDHHGAAIGAKPQKWQAFEQGWSAITYGSCPPVPLDLLEKCYRLAKQDHKNELWALLGLAFGLWDRINDEEPNMPEDRRASYRAAGKIAFDEFTNLLEVIRVNTYDICNNVPGFNNFVSYEPPVRGCEQLNRRYDEWESIRRDLRR